MQHKTYKTILASKQAKNYIRCLKQIDKLTRDEINSDNPLVIGALSRLEALEPIEIVVITNSLAGQEFARHSYYLEALEVDTMFACAYLRSVLGAPPYHRAEGFGLDKSDIESLQKQWRSVGIDPLTSKPLERP